MILNSLLVFFPTLLTQSSTDDNIITIINNPHQNYQHAIINVRTIISRGGFLKDRSHYMVDGHEAKNSLNRSKNP